MNDYDREGSSGSAVKNHEEFNFFDSVELNLWLVYIIYLVWCILTVKVQYSSV